MANIEKKYLDYAGLQHYDEKIKALISAGDQASKDYVDEKIGTLDTNVTTVAAAILAEKTRAEAAEQALEAKVGEEAKAAVTHAATAEDVEAGKAQAEGDEVVDTPASDATGLFAKIEALEEALGEDGSVADQIADAIDDLDLANTYAAKSVEDTVATLVGNDKDKSVRAIANEELAKQLVPENAKESLDTLAEIAAWIQAHPEDASAMNEAIQALQTQVGKEAVAGTEVITGYKKEGEDAISVEAYEALQEEEKADYVAVTEMQGATAATGLEKKISDLDGSTDARLDALEIAAGLKGDDAEQTLAERVAALESVSYVAIDNDEIDDLFTE